MKRIAIGVATITILTFLAWPALALQERGQAGQAAGQSGERGGAAVGGGGGGGGDRGPAGGGGGSSVGSMGGGGGSSMGSGGGGFGGGGSSMGSMGGSPGSSSSGGAVGSRIRGGDYSRAGQRTGGAATGRAVSRSEGGASPKGASPATTGEAGGWAAAAAGPVREVPQYSRPRGDRPATGSAVTRGPGGGGRPPSSGYPGYYPPYWGGDYWYWYPYGYGYPYWGSFGLGFFYYDCWYWGYGPCGFSGYYGGGGYAQADNSGSLKLKVKPRHAEVYVDGYYSGVVDNFDGSFQKLKLQSGGHRVEIRAEGYETLVFDVLIPPWETITYTGALKPKGP
jgi:hypothetical protein